LGGSLPLELATTNGGGRALLLAEFRKEQTMSLSRRKVGAAVLSVAGFILGIAAAVAGSPASTDPGKLIVHEWGTFLSVQGSDGQTLGGMVDSDEVLPPFVETRDISTWQRSMWRLKAETPVTYFYTDRPRDVQVQVRMPQGALTHWFPNVCRFGPKPDGKTPRNSYLDWCTVSLIPDSAQAAKESSDPIYVAVTKKGHVHSGRKVAQTDKEIVLRADFPGATDIRLALEDLDEFAVSKMAARIPAPHLPKVKPDLVWRHARETDSALVRVQGWSKEGNPEYFFEKFLFYRGLGTFTLPLEVRPQEGCKTDLTLTLHNTGRQPLRGLFAIQVTQDTISWGALPDLPGQATRVDRNWETMSPSLPLEQGVQKVKHAVAAALVAAGLYPKEAQAMVNTWERSYFRTEGVRVLYVLPRRVADEVMPIQIRPAPDDLVRVMVGRVEVLTPRREEQLARFLAQMGAKESDVRKAAQAGVQRLGRIAEPALRRVLAQTSDPEIRRQAAALLDRAAAGNKE
jgi:hypothetical protein